MMDKWHCDVLRWCYGSVNVASPTPLIEAEFVLVQCGNALNVLLCRPRKACMVASVSTR